jgi:16S rRNA (adenine1518-N6/adenine1519-N6)-dimethyltransferase
MKFMGILYIRNMSGFQAKKRYGQHFLHDKRIGQKIVDQLTDQSPYILEIGPGLGVLTRYLKDLKYKDLYLVEIDSEAIEQLKQDFPELAEHITKADILELDWSAAFDSPLAVIGNFPYQISAPLTFKILEYKGMVREVVGMFQYEVAQRLAASPGSKTYGITSVLTQAFYDAKFAFKVKPGAFQPPPKVDSGVIHLERNERAQLPCDETLFRDIVKSTFQHRRKMLRNTLKPWLDEQTTPQLEGYLKQRPEQLSVEDFIEMTCVIENSVQPHE